MDIDIEKTVKELVIPIKELVHPSESEIAEFGNKVEAAGWSKTIARNDWDGAIEVAATAYKNNLGLLLAGNAGVGKTAFAMALSTFSKGYCEFIDLADPIDADTMDIYAYPNRTAERIWRNLILDDMGAEQTFSDYGRMRELVGEFICHYHSRGNGTIIITTNLTGKDFLARYGQRVMSRLNDMCMVYRFEGTDKRGFRK